MGCFGYICKGCGTAINGNCFSGGEKCVMIHVRNGKEVGRVEGHYDEYGRVIEQEGMDEELRFRGEGSGINGHREICNSEFDMEDSYSNVEDKKIYKKKPYSLFEYCNVRLSEDLVKYKYDVTKLPYFDYLQIVCRKKNKNVFDTLNNITSLSYKLSSGEMQPDNVCITQMMIDTTMKIIFEGSYLTLLKNPLFEYNKEFRLLKDYKLKHYSGIVAWHSKCYKKATEEERKDLTPSKSDPNQSWGRVRKTYQ